MGRTTPSAANPPPLARFAPPPHCVGMTTPPPPLRRFAPPPHCVGRTSIHPAPPAPSAPPPHCVGWTTPSTSNPPAPPAPPALRATSPLRGEDYYYSFSLRPSFRLGRLGISGGGPCGI